MVSPKKFPDPPSLLGRMLPFDLSIKILLSYLLLIAKVGGQTSHAANSAVSKISLLTPSGGIGLNAFMPTTRVGIECSQVCKGTNLHLGACTWTGLVQKGGRM